MKVGYELEFGINIMNNLGENGLRARSTCCKTKSWGCIQCQRA